MPPEKGKESQKGRNGIKESQKGRKRKEKEGPRLPAKTAGNSKSKRNLQVSEE